MTLTPVQLSKLLYRHLSNYCCPRVLSLPPVLLLHRFLLVLPVLLLPLVLSPLLLLLAQLPLLVPLAQLLLLLPPAPGYPLLLPVLLLPLVLSLPLDL